MSKQNPISVLLAEDHLVVREGLRSLINAQSDIEVVCETATGSETVKKTLELRPDVVVMDIAMPRLNGLEAARQILLASPKARILILSGHSDDAFVERVMELGGAGYLVKQTSIKMLIDAIRQVHKGEKVFSQDIGRRFTKRHRKTPDRKGKMQEAIYKLTIREVEVLQQVAEGAANKQIAAELGISIKTVEKHRDHLMQKLDIHETAGLTRYAIETGVIESSVQVTILPSKD